VLYETLTGRRAFEGEDVSDTLAAVLRAEPDWSSLRIDRDVVEAYRASGRGWQTRANAALRAFLQKGGLATKSVSKRRARVGDASRSKGGRRRHSDSTVLIRADRSR
jgi:hypothetical protein